MKVHLSTTTVFAHENRNRAMNLHYHPIAMIESSIPLLSSHLRDITWSIVAEPIGSHSFDIDGYFSPFEEENGKSYIEFDLSKPNISFQHDPYPCEIVFKATIDSPLSSPVELELAAWGVVKVKWSKGLR